MMEPDCAAWASTIILDLRISDFAARIAFALADHVGTTDINTTVDRIAGAVGAKPAAVQSAIDSLAGSGYVRIVSDRGRSVYAMGGGAAR